MGLHADWLNNLAAKLEKGEDINPCPKALRRAASRLPDDPAHKIGGLICDKCGQACSSTGNGKCPDCYNEAQASWAVEYAQRQDPSQFDMGKLVRLLLTQLWQHQCKFTQEGNPLRKGQQKWVVGFTYKDGSITYLRHSGGPLQGYFWDIYGDDMHSPELALIALSQAPAPTRVGVVITTHGN